MNVDQAFSSLKAWKAGFLKQARQDHFYEVQRQIDYLELPTFEDAFVDFTIDLVTATASYLSLDNRDVDGFIKSQKYRLSPPDLPFYCLTFVINEDNAGRLLCNQKMKGIDLFDLYNHPWSRLKTAGFDYLYVSRLDGHMIDDSEMREIETHVKEDLYFDYTPEQMGIDVEQTDLIDTVKVIFWPHYEAL